LLQRSAFARRPPTIPDQSHRIDLDLEGNGTSFVGGFRIKHVGFSESQLERLHPSRVFPQQMAQIRCRVMRGCDGKQHFKVSLTRLPASMPDAPPV